MNGLTRDVRCAREATLAWLDGLDRGDGVYRFSPAHNLEGWPGMLLPGTYNAAMCRALLGRKMPQGASQWLLSQRLPDGRFRLAGMQDDAVYKKPDLAETWEYIDFHVTNYALGALEVSDGPAPRLEFLTPYLEERSLAGWLAHRDWSDPWQEGNNLVNLASFYLLAAQAGDTNAKQRLSQMIAHLEATQDPGTGFWGDDQSDGKPILHAMAGAMHIFHLWYVLERPLPHQEAAIDYTLTLDPEENLGACLDVDAVDLLFHGARLCDYHRPEIDAWLAAKGAMLLAAQNPDGGFADQVTGELRFDGWVRGYVEPQGRSNTFATWFRWIALAMIDHHLYPGENTWRFRRMIGIGYAHDG